MRKFLSIFLCAGIFFITAVCAYAQNFESAGFEGEGLASPAATPYAKDYVSILWSTEETSETGILLTHGDNVISPAGNKIRIFDARTGKSIRVAELSEKVSETSRGAVLNDIYVQPTRSGICVLSAENLEISAQKKFGEIITNAAITEKYIYFGTKNESDFSFIIADLKTLETVYERRFESPVTSAAQFNDFVIFACKEKLFCVSNDGKNIVENELPVEMTHVFAGKYAVFMTGIDGKMYKIRLLDDGKIEEDSLMSCETSGVLTAPAELQNKLFVGSTEGFFVIDGLNMDILKKFPEMKNSSAPVISYGTGLRAYTAAPVATDGGKWYLYGVTDDENGQKASEIAKIIDYTNGCCAVSQSGVMLFCDSAGRIWALSVRENDILTIIIKLILFTAIIVIVMLIIKGLVKRRTKKQSNLLS